MFPLKYVMHVTNNQFSDKFNDGGRLLSSVVLFISCEHIFSKNHYVVQIPFCV